MMPPGRKFVGANLRLRSDFMDDDGTLIDPETVRIYITPPSGGQALFTYETNDEVDQLATGQFYCDIIPNVSGRWFFRWEGITGTTTVAKEGNFMIDYSPHVEGAGGAYGLASAPQTSTGPDTWANSEW